MEYYFFLLLFFKSSFESHLLQMTWSVISQCNKVAEEPKKKKEEVAAYDIIWWFKENITFMGSAC